MYTRIDFATKVPLHETQCGDDCAELKVSYQEDVHVAACASLAAAEGPASVFCGDKIRGAPGMADFR